MIEIFVWYVAGCAYLGMAITTSVKARKSMLGHLHDDIAGRRFEVWFLTVLLFVAAPAFVVGLWTAKMIDEA